MKKIFLFIILFGPTIIFAQITGDGTSGNPYTGTSSSGWSVSGSVYCGDITITDGTCTISAGTTLRFGAGKVFTISGTAILSAIGTGTNYITFTASGTSWGHIYFSTTSETSSQMDYCVVEKGSTSGLSPAYGGGIHINSNKVLISNSIFRNNSAGWGGGVFLNKYNTTSISNTVFRNNSASSDGGGFYAWGSTNATISNCLFYSNSASGGRNIFLGDDANDVKIINSIVVSTASNSVRLMSNNDATRPSFKNCIIWGSSSPVIYVGQTPQTTDFTFCAIQDPVSGSTSNCITLNASNTDPSGPNFVSTTTPDYSILFISPCRDAGTNTGAPTTDIIGTSRFGTTDIGAYENQHSRWTGTTSTAWGTNTNWYLNMLPGSSSNVVIPDVTNDPVISSGDVTVVNLVTETGGNLSVGSGRLLSATKLTNAGTTTLQAGGKGTITTITNSGTFKLESDASSIASLITDNFSGTNATTELYLTGGDAGDKAYRWHYISSPVTSLSVTTFAPAYTENVAGWYDNRVSTTLSQGWVAYDGYIYSTGGMGGPTFTTLNPGIGYDYFDGADDEYTFSGQFNSSNLNIGLSRSVDDNLHGFNLLGNPYPCGLNWDIITANGSYPSNTSKWITYTKDNAYYTYNNGVGVPSGTDGHIPPMQGFFVRTYSTGNSLPILLSAREHNSTARYKGSSSEISLVRLSVTENGKTDETVVRFDESAKSGIDYDFDAQKMFISETTTQIYTRLDGINYTINGLPFPESSVEIPIIVTLPTTGNHTINATQLQYLDEFNVVLKDKTTGFEANLKTNPVVTFSETSGTYADRFVLTISAILTDIVNPSGTKGFFNIFYGNSFINIQSLSDEWEGLAGDIKLYDLAGKTLHQNDNTELWKNSIVQIPAPSSHGIYIVEIKSGLKKYVGKVIVR